MRRLEGRPTSAWWSQAKLLPMLLWTAGGVGLLAGLMSLWLAGQVHGQAAGDDPATRLDNSWTYLVTATGLLMILTAAVWLAWQRGLARLLSAEGELRRSPDSQMLAWVIPVVAWWWPLQDIRQLHGLFAGRDDTEFARLTRRWWVCWLLMWAAQIAAAWTEGSVRGVVGVRVAFVLSGIAGILVLPAARCAVQVVRELTSHVIASLRP